MNIDVRKFEQVLAVARTGSFTRAAEELNISQPALSRSISNLEERFGIRLFERGRVGASLTAVGKLAVAEAEELLRRAGSFERNLRLYGQGEAGQVAFGMGSLFASMLLPALSIHFLTHRPRLSIKASAKAPDVLLEELLAGNIEVMFCARGQIAEERGIVLENIAPVNIGLLVNAGHTLARTGTVSLQEITRFPMLSGVELSASVRKANAGAFICDNYQILRETVLNTDGVLVTSPQFVAEDLAKGRLVQLRIADNPLPARVDLCAVALEGATLSPAANAVVDYVRQQLSPDDRTAT